MATSLENPTPIHDPPPPAYDNKGSSPLAAAALEKPTSSNVQPAISTDTAVPTSSLTTEHNTYNMYYTTSRCSVRLHLNGTADSAPCVYYEHTNLKTLHTPQVRLLEGDSKGGRMVAYARLQNMSRHMLVGHGDYVEQTKKGGPGAQWEELRRDKNSLRRSDYTFGYRLREGSGGRQTYTWRKDMGAKCQTVYQCVDERGNVLATHNSGGMFNWKKAGEIGVAKGLEKELEEILIVSALGIWVFEALSYQSLIKGYESGKGKQQKDGKVVDDDDSVIS